MVNKVPIMKRPSSKQDRIKQTLQECAVLIQEEQTGIEQAVSDSEKPATGALSALEENNKVVVEALQSLTGRVRPISESEIDRAAELLQLIVTNSNPAQIVSDHLPEIDTMLPALIELNIRQAQVDGRHDLAAGLRALQTNINLQLALNTNPDTVDSPNVFSGRNFTKTLPRVVVIGGDPDGLGDRSSLISESLSLAGCSSQIVAPGVIPSAADYDVMIACNPHLQPEILEALAAGAASKKIVLVDLTSNFEGMPHTAPEYIRYHLDSIEAARAYTSALLLATGVTVSSASMANVLKNTGNKVWVVPDGWSRNNSMWERPATHHRFFNIGWVSTSGQIEDILPYRRILIRTLREFQFTQLIIYGDISVYQLFESLPENRRMFVPETASDDYPYFLDQLDLLVIPHRNIPYNLTLSDKMVMEAGVKAIPWVASPIPSYQEWAEGGILASSPDEWHTYIRQIIMDHEVWETLSKSGKSKSLTREASVMGQKWLQVFNEVVNISGSGRTVVK